LWRSLVCPIRFLLPAKCLSFFLVLYGSFSSKPALASRIAFDFVFHLHRLHRTAMTLCHAVMAFLQLWFDHPCFSSSRSPLERLFYRWISSLLDLESSCFSYFLFKNPTVFLPRGLHSILFPSPAFFYVLFSFLTSIRCVPQNRKRSIGPENFSPPASTPAKVPFIFFWAEDYPFRRPCCPCICPPHPEVVTAP